MKCSLCNKSNYISKEEAISSLKYQQSIGNLNNDFVIDICKSCNYWVISRNYSYSNSCKKNVYVSKDEAENVKMHLQKEQGTILNIYFCNECRGYHLTKKQNNY